MRSRCIALAVCAAALATVSVAPAVGQSIKTYRHILLDGHRVKWGPPEAGTGAIVTYATVDTAVEFPGARNCSAMVPIGPLLAASHIAAATFDVELSAAFALWSAVATSASSRHGMSGVRRHPDRRSGRAARAGFHQRRVPIDATTAIRGLSRSLICLSPEEHWKVGFDGDLAVYDLRYTLLHEIGHAIGLDHPAIAGQLMDFRYMELFRTPQAGDVHGRGRPLRSEPDRHARPRRDAMRLATSRPPPSGAGG